MTDYTDEELNAARDDYERTDGCVPGASVVRERARALRAERERDEANALLVRSAPIDIGPQLAAREKEIAELQADMRAMCATANDLQRCLNATVDVLGRIRQWTHEYGAALCPPRADTYGEGMRDAKAQIETILAAAQPQADARKGGRT